MRKGTQADLDLAAGDAVKLPYNVTFYHWRLGVVWRTAGLSNDSHSVRFTNAQDGKSYMMPSELRLDTIPDAGVPVPPEEPVEWVPEPAPVPPASPAPISAPDIPAPVVRDATYADIIDIELYGKTSEYVRYRMSPNERRLNGQVFHVVPSEHLAQGWVYVLGTKYPVHFSNLTAVL
jgi:hypothetical protein